MWPQGIIIDRSLATCCACSQTTKNLLQGYRRGLFAGLWILLTKEHHFATSATRACLRESYRDLATAHKESPHKALRTRDYGHCCCFRFTILACFEAHPKSDVWPSGRFCQLWAQLCALEEFLKKRKQNWLWVKTQTGTTGFGLLFLLPIRFFGYPVFLTHSQLFCSNLLKGFDRDISKYQVLLMFPRSHSVGTNRF